jgi:chromosome segregation ATPase
MSSYDQGGLAEYAFDGTVPADDHRDPHRLCEQAVRKLEREVASLTAERDRLRDSLDAEGRTVGEFGAKNLRLMGESDALRKRIGELKDERDHFKLAMERFAVQRDEALANCEHCGDMRSQLSGAEAERDAALASLTAEREQTARMRAVVEAARALVADWTAKRSTHGGPLIAAVDALDAGATTGGEDE